MNRSVGVALLFALMCLVCMGSHAELLAKTERVVVGFFQSGANTRYESCINYIPSMINSSYTHLVYSPVLINEQFKPDILSLSEEIHLEDMQTMRDSSDDLKIMLSVGSHHTPTYAWSNMIRSSSLRSTFISSLVNLTRKYDFDGFDLDWETVGRTDDNGRLTDMAEYAVLIQEFRDAIEAETLPTDKNKLIFSVTVPGGPAINRYNGTTIVENVDWINVKTFKMIPQDPTATAYHSQLKGESNNTMTVDWTISYLLDQGVSRKKIVMGLSSFGIGFELENSAHNGVGNPIVGFQEGSCSSDGSMTGNIPYFEIVENLGTKSWTSFFDNTTNCVYAGAGTTWVSYDNNITISEKVDYILEKQLLGAFIWTADQDLPTEENLASIPISRILPNSDGFEDEDDISAAVSPLPCFSLLLIVMVALVFLSF